MFCGTKNWHPGSAGFVGASGWLGGGGGAGADLRGIKGCSKGLVGTPKSGKKKKKSSQNSFMTDLNFVLLFCTTTTIRQIFKYGDSFFWPCF